MLKKAPLFKEEGVQDFIKTLWIPYIIGSAQGFLSDAGRQLDENYIVSRGESAKCGQQVHAAENLSRASEGLDVSGELITLVLELSKQ